MSKRFYILIIIIVIIGAGYRYRSFVPAFINENFVGYKNELPRKGGEFVVRAEYVPVRQFLKHVIGFAFPEYNIVYSTTKKPNLVVRGVYRPKDISYLDSFKDRVPYFAVSNEKIPLKPRRYRPTGYPFFQFTTNIEPNDKMVYIPLAAHHKSELDFLNSKPRTPPSLEEIKKRKNTAYIFRHCTSKRERFFELLAKKIPNVHAHGKCSHNVTDKPPKDVNDVYKNYNFVIAMENGWQQGYITEKIANAYESNSIPIYWGDSETVKKYFNPKSFIDISDFASEQDAVNFISKLSKDPTRIQQILAEPILTKEGEGMLMINRKELNPYSEKILKNIAKKFRKSYLQKLNQPNIFERISNKIK